MPDAATYLILESVLVPVTDKESVKPMWCPICGSNFGSNDPGAVQAKSDDLTPLWFCSDECYAATWPSRRLPIEESQ